MVFHPLGVSAEVIFASNTESFDCELRSLALTPSPEWLNTLCPPGTWPDVTWTLDLGYLPGTTDVADTDTLDQYLFNHYGEHVDYIAWPYGQNQPGYSGIASLAPGPIGGTQGEWPELSVSLPIDGQPDQVSVDDVSLESTMLTETIRARNSGRAARSRIKGSRRMAYTGPRGRQRPQGWQW